MSGWDNASVITTGAIGTAGLVVAVVAEYRARHANKLAQRANDIATDAVRQAAEANQAAHQANQLAEDANKVVALQAAQQVEQHIVRWGVEWDEQGLLLRVKNLGRDTARGTTLRVLVDGDVVDDPGERPQDVAPSGGIALELKQVGNERGRRFARYRDTVAIVKANGAMPLDATYHPATTVTVYWRTDLGQPRSEELNLTLE